jgi:hypothetical protein
MLMNLSPTAIIATLLLLGCAVAAWQVARSLRVWGRLRGDRLVTCTATGSPAAVRIDARGAAAAALVCRNPQVDIAECSLWATGGLCDRGCTVEALSPQSTTGRIASEWFDKKICVYCAKPIAARSVGHHAALLGPEGTTREWPDVPADRLRDALRTDLPVCWDCHVAETFRREHPDWVTDRQTPANHH